jgi:hypothetical protein
MKAVYVWMVTNYQAGNGYERRALISHLESPEGGKIPLGKNPLILADEKNETLVPLIALLRCNIMPRKKNFAKALCLVFASHTQNAHNATVKRHFVLFLHHIHNAFAKFFFRGIVCCCCITYNT